ncbi:MAG: protein translocase subunit SecD [Chloroflexota bacterium]
MARKNVLALIIILALFGFALWTILPLQGDRLGRHGMQLGLDLVGGVHLVYQADFPAGTTAAEQSADMDRVLTTIERRIDKYGVTEPIIQRLGTDRVLIQLPGFTDIDAAKQLVEQTGFLEFRVVELNGAGQPVYLRDYLSDNVTGFFDKQETAARLFVDDKNNPVALLNKGASGLVFTDENGNTVPQDTLQKNSSALSWIPARGNSGTPLTGDLLADASPNIDTGATGSQAEVNIEWNSTGSTIFDEIANRLYNAGAYGTPQRALGIFLDNALLSDPQILQPAYHGTGAITGSFTVQEATDLATLLKSGSLPIPLKKPPLYQEKVSATLGADFINKSVKAGVIGLALVMLFMIAYYRLPGVLASLALIFYGALVLAIFKLLPVTLTLAGIGGFVLSIGMAVDANVLIFERMKEELRTGRTLGAAIEAGFNRAWSAIRDSNFTTIIVCIILYWLGSSIVASAPVMGFALTLLIGVVVSMFTAITVTRSLLRLFIGTGLAKKTSLFSVYGERK